MPLRPPLLACTLLVLAACSASQNSAENPSADSSAAAVAPDTPVSSTPLPDDANTPAPAPSASDEDPCNAGKVGEFVGRLADGATRSAIEQAVRPVNTIRWVGPGTMTTEDYSTSRLNVMLDAGNLIRSAHCG